MVALDFWQDSKENWDDAFHAYIQFVDIPNDVNLTDSLALAGLDSLFEKNNIETLAQNLESYF